MVAADRLPVIIWRLLARELRGYDAYLRRVRYRLVPRVW
jgi:hypothetical protein